MWRSCSPSATPSRQGSRRRRPPKEAIREPLVESRVSCRAASAELPRGRFAWAARAPLPAWLSGGRVRLGRPCSSTSPDRYRCVAPNLRGFAESSAPAEVEAYRAKHLVADIAALIDQLGGPGRSPGGARLGRRRRLEPRRPAGRTGCAAWSSSTRRIRRPFSAGCSTTRAAGGERLHEFPVPTGRGGAAGGERLRAGSGRSSRTWARPIRRGRAAAG